MGRPRRSDAGPRRLAHVTVWASSFLAVSTPAKTEGPLGGRHSSSPLIRLVRKLLHVCRRTVPKRCLSGTMRITRPPAAALRRDRDRRSGGEGERDEGYAENLYAPVEVRCYSPGNVQMELLP